MRFKTACTVLAAVLLGTLVGPTPTAAREADASAQGKLRVLVVTGGHPYDTGEFEEIFLADKGIEVQFQNHKKSPKPLETISSPAVKNLDAIVLYDMWQPITEAQKKAYAAAIRGGTGLVVLHHALANFQSWPEYARMVGGKYHLAKHVENGVERSASTYKHDLDVPVEISDRDHFITRGMKSFIIHDECYGGFSVDPAVHVLLTTKHPRSGPVIGWTKPYGKGRVCYLQLGHDKQAYSNPNYRTLVARSIRWVARRTPEDAGMRPLFNGKDLTGWETSGNARFTVEDGILVGRQGPGNAPGDLFSKADYGDFECEVTWAMDWPGNSGIWLRHASGGKCYQADILEYKNPVCWSGSLYCGGKMFIALNKDPSIVRKHGWNTFRIRAEATHIVLFLNGRKVADVHDDSSASGKLGVQVHPGDQFAKMAIHIADLRIRPLR